MEALSSSQDGAATSNASLGVVEGAVLHATTIAEDAALRGVAEATVLARAANVGGVAAPVSAAADFATFGSGVVVGLESTGAMEVGGQAGLEALGRLRSEAEASSVLGEATAMAASSNANVRGFSDVASGDPIGIAGQADLRAAASGVLRATASTVGTLAQPSGATALAGGTLDGTTAPISTIALELGGQSLQVGSSTRLQADSDLTQMAEARGGSAAVQAAALSDNTVALKFNIPITIGAEATMQADSQQNSSASASTVSGASLAVVNSALLSAIQTDAFVLDAIDVGGALQLKALSEGAGKARASSVDAGADSVKAVVDQDQVYGVNLSDSRITVGAEAALQIAARSNQQAQADHGGAAAGSGSAEASAAAADQIAGWQRSNLNVGADLERFQVGALLAATAMSRNGAANGPATARVAADPGGSGTTVSGLFDAELNIGGATTGGNGIETLASSNLRAEAAGVAGPALAQVGNANGLLVGMGDATLDIGAQALLRSQADGKAQAEAVSVRADATADSVQTAFGVQQSAIHAGDAGRMRLLSALSNSGLARSVLGDARVNVKSDLSGANSTTLMFGGSADLQFGGGSTLRGLAESVAGSV